MICVFGQPVFPGDSGVDQLVEIIKVTELLSIEDILARYPFCLTHAGGSFFFQVLGTPTRDEIKRMNPNYTEFKFPQIKAHPWHKVKGSHLVAFLSISYLYLLLNMMMSLFSPDLPQKNAI